MSLFCIQSLSWFGPVSRGGIQEIKTDKSSVFYSPNSILTQDFPFKYKKCTWACPSTYNKDYSSICLCVIVCFNIQLIIWSWKTISFVDLPQMVVCVRLFEDHLFQSVWKSAPIVGSRPLRAQRFENTKNCNKVWKYNKIFNRTSHGIWKGIWKGPFLYVIVIVK